MAKINEEDIEALRERADIVEVVSGYSRLKKAGVNTHKGLCPFHSEKTPSFTVDSAKGLWHCFGCGEGGNIYHFVQKIENLPFPEAVEWLAKRTGFQLRYEEMRPGERQAAGMRARLLAANTEAARFFHAQLMSSPEAADARTYLSGRGFGREVAERWQLGWAPGRDALVRHLQNKGFSRKEIETADLGRTSDRDGSFYDTFRRRITFPTWNLQDDVVGFGARALGDEQPKYLNSSETPVFSKSRVMFGLNRAKSSIARGAAAVVVEGYTDVIALHEAGVTEAVATNGVALGESHFEQLKKFTGRALLMMDSDEAGRGATERSFGIHQRIGLEVLVAPLPAGRDPADVAREDGAEAIRKVLDGARPLVEFKLEQVISKLPTDTPEARSRAVREAAVVLGSNPDPIARREYIFKAAERIGVDVEAVERALSERGTASGGRSERSDDRRLPGHVKVEREALRLLLTATSEIQQWVQGVGENHFTSPTRRELYSASRTAASSGVDAVDAGIADDLSADALSLYTELIVGEQAQIDDDYLREIFGRLQVFELEREIKSRRNVLQGINPTVDPQKHDELFTELVGLEAKRRDMLRRIQGAA
jgi:DNA primase